MGLLDDLKKQADQLKTQQILKQGLHADKLKLVEEKMKQTFLYVNELLKQLAVVKPVNPLMFSIPGVANLQSLKFADSFIDYRRRRIGDKEYYDTVNFYIKWAGEKAVVVDCDNAQAAQRARDALWVSKIRFTEEERKNSKGILIGAKFSIPSAVVTDITFKADYDEGSLQVLAKNLFGVGTEQLVVPAPEVSEAMLEDFAKTLLGQPGNFRRFKVNPMPRPGAPR